jgi:ACS family hexuronate transporter-like MFS transporter
LRDRNVLGIVLARFIADPVWYFYLFWIPEYLRRTRGFSLADIGIYAAIPFIAADLGGILGGYASDRLTRRGLPSWAARRRVLCSVALLAPAGMLTGITDSAGLAVALISLVAMVCQCWFINTAALASDVCSEDNLASVQGLMGTAGSGAGILFTTLVGFLVGRYSYVSVFIVAGSMHLIAALVIWRLVRVKKGATPSA